MDQIHSIYGHIISSGANELRRDLIANMGVVQSVSVIRDWLSTTSQFQPYVFLMWQTGQLKISEQVTMQAFLIQSIPL